MARPSVLDDPIKRESVLRATTNRMTLDQAADEIETTAASIKRYCQTHPEFAEAMARARDLYTVRTMVEPPPPRDPRLDGVHDMDLIPVPEIIEAAIAVEPDLPDVAIVHAPPTTAIVVDVLVETPRKPTARSRTKAVETREVVDAVPIPPRDAAGQEIVAGRGERTWQAMKNLCFDRAFASGSKAERWAGLWISMEARDQGRAPETVTAISESEGAKPMRSGMTVLEVPRNPARPHLSRGDAEVTD